MCARAHVLVALGGEEGKAAAEAADGGHAHVDGAGHLLLREEVRLALDHHDGRLRPRDEEIQPRFAARTYKINKNKEVAWSFLTRPHTPFHTPLLDGFAHAQPACD